MRTGKKAMAKEIVFFIIEKFVVKNYFNSWIITRAEGYRKKIF
jgi:hypothetical protein